VDFSNCHLLGCKFNETELGNILNEGFSPAISLSVSAIDRCEKKVICITIPEGHQKPYTFIAANISPSNAPTEPKPLPEIPTQEDPPQSQRVEPQSKPWTQFSQQAAENPPEGTARQRVRGRLHPALPVEGATRAPSKIKPPLNHRQQAILSYLNENPSIKNKDYRSQFSVSHKTAHLELVDMVAKQVLGVEGAGRNTCYVLACAPTEPAPSY